MLADRFTYNGDSSIQCFNEFNRCLLTYIYELQGFFQLLKKKMPYQFSTSAHSISKCNKGLKEEKDFSVQALVVFLNDVGSCLQTSGFL